MASTTYGKPLLSTEQTASASSVDVAGIKALCGGMLFHIMLGTVYCWGDFNSYSPAGMKNFDGSFDASQSSEVDILQVLPFSIVFQAFSMPFGTPLNQRFGPGLCSLFGGVLCGAGLILASFANSLGMFVILYAGIYGCGVGLGYTQPLVCGFKHFPNSKGIVSGFILGAFGLGGFIFNNVGSAIFNPEGLEIDPATQLFPPSVTEAFAPNLRRLGFVYLVITVIASSLIRDPTRSVGSQTALAVNTPGLSVCQAIRTSNFWVMWLVISFCAQGGLYIGSVSKAIALEVPALNDDRYLSMVAAVGALTNGLTRPIFGYLYDRFGYRVCFSAVASLQAVALFMLPRTQSPILYPAALMLSWAALAGNFAMAPPEVHKIFGNAAVYPAMFTSFAFSGIFGIRICNVIAENTTNEAAFLYLFSASVAALFLVQCHRPPSVSS